MIVRNEVRISGLNIDETLIVEILISIFRNSTRFCFTSWYYFVFEEYRLPKTVGVLWFAHEL